MYLKRIEAIGFKSFATKTVINFDKGLTAIVGPNGSGKSNVSDSIRFVLGEQSVKSLRGGKMEDIIFAGTDTKKALNMAEVTIVLDNENRHLSLEFNEVSITRRVYRSGGGEYLINGEKARLKDVTHLIMDSGIGHDSLSMISQDQVKQVIEGKSEDRRLILEESAGILKYKTRKKEAVRKLEATEENLRRVHDIIGELEYQIEPLRIQAKEAKEYLEIKEKLSDLEIRLLAHDIKIDNDQLAKFKNENEELTIRMLEISNQLEKDEQNKIDLTIKHNDLTQIIQELQFDLTDYTEEIGKKLAEAGIIEERLSNTSQNKAQIEGRKIELEKNLMSLRKNVDESEKAAQDASLVLFNKQKDNKETYKIKHIKPIEEELKNVQSEYKESAVYFNNLEKESSTLDEQMQHATYQLSSAKSQLGFLLDAKEDFVGFSEGAKQVLKANKKGRLIGIEGAVAELVSVPSEYDTAFDVILGPLANQIITKTDEDAKKAITFLKDNRFGRATFLPLNVMKSRRLSDDLLLNIKNLDGFISLASDALIYGNKYKDVVENLVGNVVISKDLNSGKQIARITNHRFRIVTLSGDVINPGGSMTGGTMARKNSSSILTQNQKIKYQEDLITKLEDTMLEVEAKKLVLHEKMEEVKIDVGNKQIAVADVQTKLNQAHEDSLRLSYELKVEIATLEANLNNQVKEARRLNEEYDKVEDELENLIQTLENSDQTTEDLKISHAILLNEITKIENEKEKTIEEVRISRLKLVDLTESLKNLELEIRETRRVSNDMNLSLNKLSGDIGKVDVRIDIAIEKLEREYEMTFDYAVLHYPLKADISGARTEVHSLNRKLLRFGNVNIGAIDEFDRVKERYDFLNSESNDLRIAAGNLQASIDEMDSEMVIKFKETFDLVRVRYIETFTELFGGGQADLILTDPHDLLNTGVEIVARPPGTKLGTSTLLSGGQKALTSIAMLFAILKVRTIPFCILDEVEAALDEANVARYANYLKQFSDQTQFIVITHRRGTMEEADVLYGVTMQERGITTMVSVKMDSISKYVDN